MNAVVADAFSLPLADRSVDLIVTSPPYFNLRTYGVGDELGNEATPWLYVKRLLAATEEMVRVLKPHGSLWINLGDTYVPNRRNSFGPRGGSLIGIPWRYAIGVIDELGLILRAEVIWSKPNGLPKNLTDRVRTSHETWFHFVLQNDYYSAVDRLRDPMEGWDPNLLGQLPGSVWTIATQKLNAPKELGVDHFATFPTAWPKRIIQGWSPESICRQCRQGLTPVLAKAPWWEEFRREHRMGDYIGNTYIPGQGYGEGRAQRPTNKVKIPIGPKATITGEACACDTPSEDRDRAVVLDPFGGSGTTALVAEVLGRTGVSMDMSPSSSRLAQWRIGDQRQREKV